MTEKNNTNAELIRPKIAYVQDLVPDRASQLYTLDLQTGRANLVGKIATDVYDLAFVGSQLYGLKQSNNDTQLVEINRTTGEATGIGDIGFEVVGLAYNYRRKTLYATAAKQLIAIDLETAKGTPAITVSKDKRGCGEVAFDNFDRAYITLIGTNRKKHLASCDLDSGKVKVIGDIGFPDLASMEFVDNILYGITGNFFNLGKDGQLLRIDTKTGKGTVVAQTIPASRWAGMTVGAALPASNVGKPTNNNSDSETLIKEEKQMQLLTIDTKANCYVIDPNGMNSLQENVASKATLEQGNYEIKITSEDYNSNNAEEEKPAVLLWVYGTDGSTFINRKTGVETGATWSTLNGRYQTLELEVKQQAVVCALFFRVGNEEISGAIDLTITSDSPDFQPQQLTVDSKNNCYNLDGQYLSGLKQWDNNFVELEPGNYRLKIQSANASYWSEEKKFDLEPWALIWIEKGSFITDFAGMEISETWCSLNGFKDEVLLKVNTKTTLSGLFFDTYKEDNEGQITVGIETLTEDPFDPEIRIPELNLPPQPQEPVPPGGSRSSFNFRFDRTQIESTWREMAGKIESSLTVTDEQDPKKEAQYWDSLEKWILKGYQSQAKDLAMQVARLEFMMTSITQQMEGSFNQNFQAWSTHFDERLNNSISTRITNMVDERVNRKLSQEIQKVEQRIEERINEQVEREIDTRVERKVASLSQEIEKRVVRQIEGDLNRRIDNNINTIIDRRSTEIEEAVTERIQANIKERIDNSIDLKITEHSQEIRKIATAEIKADLDKTIGAIVNVELTDLSTDLSDRITKQVGVDFNGRIETVNSRVDNLAKETKESSLALITAEFKSFEANIEREINQKIDVKMNERATNIENNVTKKVKVDLNKIVNNVVNFNIDNRSGEIKKGVIEQIKQDLNKKIKAEVNLKVTNLTSEIDRLIAIKIPDNVDKRLDAVLNLKINDLRQNIKNLIIQQIQPDIKLQILSAIGKSTEDMINAVFNRIEGDIDNRIQVNFDNKIIDFRNDVTNIVNKEINHNNEAITTVIIDDISNRDFFVDMKSIEAQIDRFFDRVGQFETRLNSRMDRGDDRLRHWTLEQLTALQGCLSDRQTLSDMFEKFAANLRDGLDNADCVQPTRFTSWATIEKNAISTTEASKLPGNSQ